MQLILDEDIFRFVISSSGAYREIFELELLDRFKLTETLIKKQMKISLVAAIAQNNAIGKNNELLWHLPADFKHFKTTTSGHFILMGRKTFESFPKPLPNRTHLIITRQKDYQVAENCFAFSSVNEALQFAKQQNQEIVYVIGGGEIYKQTIEAANELIITHVKVTFEDADAFFPQITSDWSIVSEEFHKSDEKNQYDFTITLYKK